MISKSQLASAVAAGVLDQATADALTAHVQQLNQNENTADEEHFRLVTGFNDIFVVIASVLLFVALSSIGGQQYGGLLVALAAWGLAEFFVLKRRMALPAIILLIYFVTSIFSSCFTLLTGNSLFLKQLFTGGAGMPILIASAITVAFTWLHWMRFKVPITVAAGVTVLVIAFIAVITTMTKAFQYVMPLAILAGISVFLLAMWWDSADTKRITRKSDVAFWLHLLAAPLMIHPIFSLLGVLDGNIHVLEASVVFVLYLLIAIVSLLIDRRALMVSSLGYVIYVFATLISTSNGTAGFAMTALVIGSALLLLSAFWHVCRRQLLRVVPERLRIRLPE